jgi:hypothetical protein
VPTVIHALFAAFRFFHSGLAPLVSIQSWNATVTVGAVLPLLGAKQRRKVVVDVCAYRWERSVLNGLVSLCH